MEATSAICRGGGSLGEFFICEPFKSQALN